MAALFTFFYTGSPTSLGQQPDTSKSLGGFISSSPVGNNMLRNVFGDITQLTRSQNRPECRAIAIQNIGTSTATQIRLTIDYPNDGDSTSDDDVLNPSAATYLVGYAVPSQDACGDLQSELLPSIYSTPFTVSLVDASVNPLVLPDIAAGSYLVIYLKRILAAAFLQPLTTQQYVDIMNNVITLDTVENISLNLSWV